jgi:anti-sigma-K factor RskA
MSEKSHTEIDRLTDLLAEKSILGLSSAEESELRELQAAYGMVDDNTFDLAVAAFDLAFGQRRPIEMPTNLRQRILAQAPRYLSSVHIMPTPTEPDQALTSVSAESRSTVVPPRPSQSNRLLSNPFNRRESVFVLVTVASIFIALFAWQRRTETSPPIVSAADQRTALLDTGPHDLVQAQWKPGADSQGQADPIGAQVNGDVIWSDAQQQGFMRFAGLPVNDPTIEQYQLWIFDANRDTRYPVDGGVFDIDSNAEEIVIPIKASIHVAQATLFAVTIEKPGGVVVSDRQRLPVLAQVQK